MTPPSRIGHFRTKCEGADAPPPQLRQGGKSCERLGRELASHLDGNAHRHVEQHLCEGLGQRIGLERGHAAAAQRLAQQEVEAADAGQAPASHLSVDAVREVLRHRLLRHLRVEDRHVLGFAGKDADIVIFDDNINIETTIIKGRVVYKRNRTE